MKTNEWQLVDYEISSSFLLVASTISTLHFTHSLTARRAAVCRWHHEARLTRRRRRGDHENIDVKTVNTPTVSLSIALASRYAHRIPSSMTPGVTVSPSVRLQGELSTAIYGINRGSPCRISVGRSAAGVVVLHAINCLIDCRRLVTSATFCDVLRNMTSMCWWIIL